MLSKNIPDEIAHLAEECARSVHETWCAGRMAEGWTYGPERNDEKKETPCLVPYDELSESEKEYDRRTALQTIDFLLSSGWKLIPPESDNN